MTPEVTLLTHTPNPTRIMGLSARLCYTQGMSIAQLNDKMTDEACEKLVLKILSNKHNGVLEHPVFTFGVEGVSRDFLQQMARHRHTSFDVQSLHYTVAQEGFNMAAPKGLGIVQREAWEKARESSWQVYKKLVAEGVPKETARHILPGGIETRLLMTACLRQWMTFVNLRVCDVNCDEIRTVAMKVKKHLEKLMPYLEPYLGPSCHTDSYCAEGKKFCSAPWKLPCKIQGDGLSTVVHTKEEAKNFKP